MPHGVLVFLGGGLGATLRWATGLVWAGPWGVWAVNVLGSALLAALAHPDVDAPPTWRALLGTGVLGGFTTYSTFNLDVLTLLQRGRPVAALALVAATSLGCLAGAALAYAVTGRLARP
jgi:CrcB protein